MIGKSIPTFIYMKKSMFMIENKKKPLVGIHEEQRNFFLIHQ